MDSLHQHSCEQRVHLVTGISLYSLVKSWQMQGFIGSNDFDALVLHLSNSSINRSIDINTAACIDHDCDVKASLFCIQRCKLHAEVCSDTRDEHFFHIALFKCFFKWSLVFLT